MFKRGNGTLVKSVPITESNRKERSMAKTRIIRRDAGNGQFVTPAKVKSNPKTTVTEHRPVKKK